MTTITRAHAEQIVTLMDAGLSSGLGTPEPGKMCVEAVICYALGLPHGDDPGCVAQSVRRLKIRLNDAGWSSNQARAQGLRRLALVQLGSAGVLDEPEFRRRVMDVTIRRVVPIGLRAAATRNPTQAKALEAAAVRCEVEGTREAAQNGERVARTAATFAATFAAEAAAATTATYATATATFAAYATFAATFAAEAAAADAARTRDRVLGQFAEWVVEILIDMAVPGVQWLDLVPVESV